MRDPADGHTYTTIPNAHQGRRLRRDQVRYTVQGINRNWSTRATSFLQRYPKMHRDTIRKLRSVLAAVPGLTEKESENIARAINDIADKACDLNEIYLEMIEGNHGPAQLAELLSVFELTTEQINGNVDTIDGRLYELSDRLNEGAGNQASTEAPQ